MIYYNESLALDEAGFDVVDALIECPIYNKYENMISSIVESGFITESEKIEFRVLEENVFTTIGNALKKAWTAICEFFKGLASKITGFFKSLSLKKLKSAIDKKIKNEDAEIKKAIGETKIRLIKKYGVKADEFDKKLENSYACLNVDKLMKETVNSSGLKNLENKLKRIPQLKDADKIKSNEEAEKQLKKISEFAIDKNDRMTLIDPNDLKEKIPTYVDDSKYKSFVTTIEGEKYIIKSKVVDYFFDLSNINLMNNNKAVQLYNKVADVANTFAKNVSELEDISPNSPYGNKVLKGIIKLQKDIIKSVNLDKNGLNMITNASLKAYKDAAGIILSFGTKEQKNTVKYDNPTAKNESYDPWAGLNESYDPWAGLD